MDFAVMLTAYSHRVGLVIQLAHQAVELNKLAPGANVRIYVASVELEQNPGLWELVRRHFREDQLFVLDSEIPALTRAAAQLLEREERVVFHVQGNQQLRALLDFKRRHPERVKFVYSVHSFRNASWKRIPFSWVASRMLRRHVDYTVFYAPHAAGRFVRSQRIMRGGRGGYLFQGIEDWSPDDAVDQLDEHLEPEFRSLLERPDSKCFIYLTRELMAKGGKGHDWMLDSVAPALRRHRDAYVIIAGRGDAETVSIIRQRANELDIGAQIILPGWIDRRVLAWVIANCDAGIVASRSETFGHAFIEPMALGKPVIGTRVGVAEWLIMDYFTGIGFEYGDHVGLSRAFEYMVTHPEEAKQMGRNAAELARPLFRWENVASGLMGVYQSVWRDD